MIEVSTAFLLIGMIIVIGYLGVKFFERTKIPDVIILMLLGLIIGPFLNILGTDAISAFWDIVPYFAAIALLIILFEAGMQLNFFRVLANLSLAVFFTGAVATVTIILISTAVFILYGWPLLVCVLFGIIVSGTDSAIVIYLIHKTSASEDTKTLIDLETTLNDIQIIFAFAVISMIKAEEISFQTIGQQILGGFSVAIIVGAFVALIWLIIQGTLKDKKYEYLLTLAVLFLLYAVVEYFKANGAIAAFVFGIILGNAKDITSMLRMKQREIDGKIAMFQQEISFFVRTFFFVYLGIIFDLSVLTIITVVVALLLTGLAAVSRVLVAWRFSKYNKNLLNDLPLISSAMSRGIAAAVLASIAATALGGMPSLKEFGDIGKDIFNITFLLIFFSAIFTTIGIFISERKMAKKPIEKGESGS